MIQRRKLGSDKTDGISGNINIPNQEVFGFQTISKTDSEDESGKPLEPQKLKCKTESCSSIYVIQTFCNNILIYMMIVMMFSDQFLTHGELYIIWSEKEVKQPINL